MNNKDRIAMFSVWSERAVERCKWGGLGKFVVWVRWVVDMVVEVSDEYGLVWSSGSKLGRFVKRNSSSSIFV